MKPSRLRKRFNIKGRLSSESTSQPAPICDPSIIANAADDFPGSNPIAIASKAKNTKIAKKKNQQSAQQATPKLSKRQEKQLRRYIEKSQKRANRGELIDKLKLSNAEYEKVLTKARARNKHKDGDGEGEALKSISIAGMQTKGLKRHFREKLGKGKKKKQKLEEVDEDAEDDDDDEVPEPIVTKVKTAVKIRPPTPEPVLETPNPIPDNNSPPEPEK